MPLSEKIKNQAINPPVTVTQRDSSADLRESQSIEEDFFAGLAGTIFTATVSGADAAVAAAAAPTGRIGLLSFTTGSTNAGKAAILTDALGYYTADGTMTLECAVVVDQLSAVGDRFVIRIGFGDSATGDFTEGAYFEYAEATSPNWYFCTARGGSRTKASSGVAVAAGTYVKLKIVINAAATAVSFYINGDLVGIATLTIPNVNTGIAASIIKSAGTTACLFKIDWVWIYKQLSSTR